MHRVAAEPTTGAASLDQATGEQRFARRDEQWFRPCRHHRCGPRHGDGVLWRMAYVRGPEGIIVSLAERID